MPPKKRRFSPTVRSRRARISATCSRCAGARLPDRARRRFRPRWRGRSWAQQAAKDADDGRFAGAVRPEEAHDFAARDAETDMVHGDEGAEPLDEVVGDDLVAVLRSVRLRRIGHANPGPSSAHPRFRAAPRTRPRCWAQRPRSSETAPRLAERLAQLRNAPRRHRPPPRGRRRRPAGRWLTARLTRRAVRTRAAVGGGNRNQRSGHALLERRRACRNRARGRHAAARARLQRSASSR